MKWPMFAVIVSLAPSVAYSQARTFVASNGNDLNPGCTITAPCRNFQAALTTVTDGGEVVVLDSAGYGTASITKGVTITAPTGMFAGSRAITVNAPGKVVRIEGLYFSGAGVSSGIGLSIDAANAVNVDRCVFAGLTDAGIAVSPASTANVMIDNSEFWSNSKGLRIETGRVMLQHSTLAENAIAVYAGGNGGSDSYTPTGTTRVRITGCLIKNNGTALQMHNAGPQSVSGCNGTNIWLRLASNTYSHIDSVFVDNTQFVGISGTTTSNCSDASQYDVGRSTVLPF